MTAIWFRTILKFCDRVEGSKSFFNFQMKKSLPENKALVNWESGVLFEERDIFFFFLYLEGLSCLTTDGVKIGLGGRAQLRILWSTCELMKVK